MGLHPGLDPPAPSDELFLEVEELVAVEVGAVLVIGIDLGVEGLDLVEEKTAAAELVEIPATAGKLFESGGKPGNVEAGSGDVFGDFLLGQTARTGIG